MQIVINGKAVDVTDDEAVAIHCKERASALIKKIEPDKLGEFTEAVYGAFSYAAVKFGALAAVIKVRGDAGMELPTEMLFEFADLFGSCVDIEFDFSERRSEETEEKKEEAKS